MDGEEAASTVDVETGSDLLALESTAAAYRDLPIYRVPMLPSRGHGSVQTRRVSPRCWPSDSNPICQLWWQEPEAQGAA